MLKVVDVCGWYLPTFAQFICVSPENYVVDKLAADLNTTILQSYDTERLQIKV